MDSIEEIMIKEFYHNERTELGKSVVRQLCELLNVDLGEE